MQGIPLALIDVLQQLCADRGYRLFDGQIFRDDAVRRAANVVRDAALKALCGSVGVLQIRADSGTLLQDATVEEDGEGGVEEDNGGVRRLLQQKAIRNLFGGASAEGDDRFASTQTAGDGGGFAASEFSLAVRSEDFLDGVSGVTFDHCIDIEEVPAEIGGEEATYGALTCAHEAGKDDAFGKQGGRGWGHGGFGYEGCHDGLRFVSGCVSEKRKPRPLWVAAQEDRDWS